MRVFRKRKKFGNFQGTPDDAAPIPDIVYQFGAEQAARYAAGTPPPLRAPYSGMNGYGQQAAFEYQPGYGLVGQDQYSNEIPQYAMGGRVRSGSPLNFLAAGFRRGRSKSRPQYGNEPMDNVVRPGSPAHFAGYPPGTPVKYRRRVGSPALVRSRPSSPFQFIQQEPDTSGYYFEQERVSSPYHFLERSRPGSPDIARRLRRAQLSQDIQNIEKQQKRQLQMMGDYSGQFIPQYQQPYYPMIDPSMQGYSYAQQPQMYGYY